MREIPFLCFLAAKLLHFLFTDKRFILNTRGRMPKGNRQIPTPIYCTLYSFCAKNKNVLVNNT